MGAIYTRTCKANRGEILVPALLFLPAAKPSGHRTVRVVVVVVVVVGGGLL